MMDGGREGKQTQVPLSRSLLFSPSQIGGILIVFADRSALKRRTIRIIIVVKKTKMIKNDITIKKN